MTARVLPVSEWPRLSETTLAAIWPTLNPRFAEVLVVEDGDAILGSLVLITTVHAECCEIHGGAGVSRALWSLLQARVHAAGGNAVWGAAIDEPMRRLLEKHAEAIPGQHFLVRV